MGGNQKIGDEWREGRKREGKKELKCVVYM